MQGVNNVLWLLFLLLLISAVANSWYTYEEYVKDSDFSTPEECLRPCNANTVPKTCYWKIVIEHYTTLGGACALNGSRAVYTNPAAKVSNYGNECVWADGFERSILSYNRRLPGPMIAVCEGDRVVIDVENEADGVEATIHWHGIFQNGYQYYDGVPFLTQCPIFSSNTFRYMWGADNAGTHWYHTHVNVHMIDGANGPLVVYKKDDPSRNLYDVDNPNYVIHMTDWMHEMSVERFPGRRLMDRGQVPKNILFNGHGQWTDPATGNTTDTPLAIFTVNRGKRYRFRIINAFGSVCTCSLTIEGHPMYIIAQDGESVEPTLVDEIITASGERVDVVLHANMPPGNYWIRAKGLGECAAGKVQQVAYLRYRHAPYEPNKKRPSYDDYIAPGLIQYNPLDDLDCNDGIKPNRVCVNQLQAAEPVDERLFRPEPDHRIITYFNFFNYSGHANQLFASRSFERFMVGPDGIPLASEVSNITFKHPPYPPISQHGPYPGDNNDPCGEPCAQMNVEHVAKDVLVELITYDRFPLPELSHPFHLHGFAFKVFAMGQFNKTEVTLADIRAEYIKFQGRLKSGMYKHPPGKDTLIVPNGGYYIVRFISNNPGWWLYHCHFAWHTATGMDMVIHTGRPEDLPPIPRGFPTCNNWTPMAHFHKRY